MRFPFLSIISFTLLFQSCTTASSPLIPSEDKNTRKYDLVLIHGLGNKHKWSEGFLDACLQIWGSGRVYVVYTGAETGVAKKNVNGRVLFIGGGEGTKAGVDSINKQVANVAEVIQTLQQRYALGSTFSIIAHSMGGLVARQFAYENPGAVAGLVTLGTPHHGSPLAESFQWVGYFLNADDALDDLKPKNIALFNHKYPVESTPLSSPGKIYLIRGVPDGSDCFGWTGELFLGWQILSTMYDTGSDGLVPHDSALIEGAKHIGDFPHYDHSDLVKQPDVAKKAAEYLP